MKSALGRVRLATVLSVTAALTALLAFGPTAVSGAAVTNAWQAKIGSAGVNGMAKIAALDTGTGLLTLKLAKMKPATYLPVTLSRGTCSSVGSTLIKFPTIKTTSTGTAARSSSLSASQVTLIKTATQAGRIAIRVGSTATGGVKCGLFAALYVPPPPPHVAATITVGREPAGAAVAPNGVWVTNWLDNSLSRIDPTTNAVLQTIPLTISGTGGPEAIAYGENALWVTVYVVDASGNSLPGSLLRIDPSVGTQQATIPIGKGAADVAVSPGAVWVPLYDDNQVLRIDPATNTIGATIPVSGNPSGVAFGFGAIWVSSWDGHLTRIDPATNQVSATLVTQDTGGDVAVSATAVWMTNVGHKNTTDGKLTRVDPAANQVTGSVDVGSFPLAVGAAGGSIWVGIRDAPTVVQVSEATTAVVGRVTVGHPVYALAATDHAIWVVEYVSAPDANTPPPPGQVSKIAY